MVMPWIVGWWAAKDPVARKAALLYPLRDLHGFIIWCASYLSKRSLWRDNNYVLLKGGRLIARRDEWDVDHARSVSAAERLGT